MRPQRILVVVLMLAVMSFGCGGGSETTSEERPLGTDVVEQTSIPIPTVAPPPPTPSPTPEPFIYVVREGDTLGGIAEEFGTSLDAIIAVNNLIDPNALRIGQQVEIPQEVPVLLNSDGTVRPGERTHIVQEGETLLEIALKYDKTLDEITSANNITTAALIQIGQALIIPASEEE